MIKRVLSDYCSGYQWKKIAESHKNSGVVIFYWVFMYLLILYPSSNKMIHASISGIGCYYLWIIPFLLGLIGMETNPLQLPKIMFLCPMNDVERRHYISLLLWVKLLVPTFLVLCMGIILIIFRIVNLSIVIIFALGELSGFIMMTIVSNPVVQTKKSSHTMVKKTWSVIESVISFIIMLLLPMYIEEYMQGIKGYFYVYTTALILIFGIAVWKLRSLPQIIEDASHYKEKFDIKPKSNREG